MKTAKKQYNALIWAIKNNANSALLSRGCFLY